MTAAKPAAWSGVIALRTSGLMRVRAIWASKGISWSWFNAFADAQHIAVPMAVDNKIGTVVGKGDSATPDIAVRTTRKLSRVLDSWA